MASDLEHLLLSLSGTKDLAEARQVVKDLEDGHAFKWRAVGDRESNFGNINLGSDPGNAFVERVTNAIDAVIEREALRSRRKGRAQDLPATPREAVETWFKVPGGRVHNLDVSSKGKSDKGRPSRQDLADNIVIRMIDGSGKKNPTIEVRDFGVGLTADQVPSTILSLNADNKIDKHYLAGAYGQGGSTVLAFSPSGALIVSRRQPDLLQDKDKDEIAVTFVRYNELDPQKNKNGRYEYLVTSDNAVPRFSADSTEFAAGTSVTHFCMDFAGYSATITAPQGSLWSLMQSALFDPVLPFWIEERRKGNLGKDKDLNRRTIAGNFTRLMGDTRDLVEHHDTVDVELRHGHTSTNIKVNYWVIRASDKSAQPIDAYVNPYRPITFTFNGQTHGTEDRKFISGRLALPYLVKHLILQVELDFLTPQARRSLLSTTRDRLRQLPFYDDMCDAIVSALSEDEDLSRLNEERKERLLSKHTDQEQEEMKKRFARLMERLRAGIDAATPSKGTGPGGRPTKEPGSRKPLPPLPLKDEPTFIEIVNTQKPIPVRIDRHALLRLNSDAPDNYLKSHAHARMWIDVEPEGVLVKESNSDFKGGRSRLTVRATEKATSDTVGNITVFLFTPKQDLPLKSRVSFRIDIPKEEPTTGKSGKAQTDVPAPIPVYSSEWAAYGWDESSVAEVKDDGKDTKIYVNVDNKHLRKLLDLGGYQESGVTRMRRNFLLYVAFYAYVQFLAEQGKSSSLDSEDFEQYQTQELDRVAQTVVHSISSASRLDEEEENA